MRWQVIGQVWRLLMPIERRRALGLLSLMILGMFLETLGIGLVVPFIALLASDDALTKWSWMIEVNATLGNPGKATLILMAMVAVTVAFFLKNAVLALMAWKQMRFAFDVQARLSRHLFAAYLNRPYVFHLQHNSAELLRNVINEVSLFTNFVVIPSSILIAEAMVLLGIVVLLFAIEPVGAAVTGSLLIAAGLLFLRTTRSRSALWANARQHHDGLRMQHAQQGLAAIKDLKLLGREASFIAEFEEHNAAAASANRKLMTLLQLPRLFLEVLAITCLTVLLFVMLNTGRALDTILPTIGLFAGAAFRLIPSANRVISSVQSLTYGLPVIATLSMELERISRTHAAVGGSTETLCFETDIQICGLEYAFPRAATKAVNQVSFEIRRGQSIGIVGSSGAGKSTLVDLLLGLLTPDAGCIKVDGREIRSNLRAWQDQIGYVPQSIYLTDDSVRRNVAFGVAPELIDDSQVHAALAAAQLDEFVNTLPEGLNSLVGERGVRLSGGQRQRIGIARALFHRPSILVLDEATSSLDTKTEEEVMRAVQALHGEKTIIIVAHRLTTVAQCDRIYRLENGKLIAEGAPDVMLRQFQSPSIQTS
jgi:ABC-type multidrug transport system fused ATPase/permease subunit